MVLSRSLVARQRFVMGSQCGRVALADRWRIRARPRPSPRRL